MSSEVSHDKNSVTSLDDCRALLFHLYVLRRDLTLKQIVDVVEEIYEIGCTEKQYKDKLARWGFFRNIRRSDRYLALHRAQHADPTNVDDLSFRVIDQEKVAKYIRRNGPVKRRQPIGRIAPQPVLESPSEIGIPERFLFDATNLIKGSFESREWRSNGNEFIINCAAHSAMERKALHAFLAQIDFGCDAAATGSVIKAFEHYRLACDNIEILVNGRYHDHLPNLLQKLNDLKTRNQTEVAEHIQSYVAELSQISVQKGHRTATVFTHLQHLDIRDLEEIEERLMAMYQTLFNVYLGGASYNSFVMMMNAARRRLTRSPWVGMNECLPSIEELDLLWGPSNRRPLDVLRLKLETLFQRRQYVHVLTEAPQLIERATAIKDDNWLQTYYLTKGYHLLGTSENLLGKHKPALQNLRHAADWEQAFRQADTQSIDLFRPEREHIEQQIMQLEASSNQESMPLDATNQY